MEDVYRHIREQLDIIHEDRDHDSHQYRQIAPKKFLAEKLSAWGEKSLAFAQGKEYSLSGILMTQRSPGMGRVFFFAYHTSIDGEKRFIEVKGYGQDGREMSLFLHPDGDIHNGMFLKNAAKEYSILNHAVKKGLRVPLPLMIGRIPRSEWLLSSLRGVKSVVTNFEDLTDTQQLDELLDATDITLLEERLSRLPLSKYREEQMDAYKQPYSAGFVIRAPLSPFRIGDPTHKYELNERNKWIAKTCGSTFWRLIESGYLHLCPGTGNWTTQAELTDMSDCYDLQRDKNLEKIVKKREENQDTDFWQDLIGQRHTGNLSAYFIEGMLGQPASLEDAAQVLELKAKDRIMRLVHYKDHFFRHRTTNNLLTAYFVLEKEHIDTERLDAAKSMFRDMLWMVLNGRRINVPQEYKGAISEAYKRSEFDWEDRQQFNAFCNWWVQMEKPPKEDRQIS